MYKLVKHYDGSEATAVLKLQDLSCIPFDPANTDYQEYLKWLEEGNTPEAADEQQ